MKFRRTRNFSYQLSAALWSVGKAHVLAFFTLLGTPSDLNIFFCQSIRSVANHVNMTSKIWEEFTACQPLLYLYSVTGNPPSPDMPSLESPSTILILILVASLYVLVSRTRRRGLPLPPGPPQLPLLGNIFDVPSTSQSETYAQWSKKIQ
jgi:hypothetical protein